MDLFSGGILHSFHGDGDHGDLSPPHTGNQLMVPGGGGGVGGEVDQPPIESTISTGPAITVPHHGGW